MYSQSNWGELGETSSNMPMSVNLLIHNDVTLFFKPLVLTLLFTRCTGVSKSLTLSAPLFGVDIIYGWTHYVTELKYIFQ